MQERDTPGFVATIAGSTTAESPTTVIAPTEELAPVTPQATAAPPFAQPRRRGRRRRHRRPRVMSRVLLLAIAAAIAIFAFGTGSDLFGLLRGGASVRTVPAEGGSLLRAVALEAALRGLPDGKVETLRVAADRIDARVVVDGRVRAVRVNDRGWVTDVPAPEEPTGTAVRIDPRAPARFVRAVTGRTGRSPADVSHLSLEGERWQLVYDDGAQFSANVNGRAIRRG